jgi:tRNA pseudouridine38-40 synthase
VTIDIVGDAFLRQMVRSIVAALIRVGMGRATAEDLVTELRSPGRAFAGAVVPPHGLCLRRVVIGTGIQDRQRRK